MDLATITPLILTFNEAPNIGRVMSRLTWARSVVVLDSGSTDGTQEIASGFGNARLVVRSFDDHASQWNFGLRSAGIETEWVLALDADYLVPDEFVSEVRGLDPSPNVAGYEARFRYVVQGRTLRSGIYPPVTVLFRSGLGQYQQDGHTQRLHLSGSRERLVSAIDHDDRKPLERWLWSQARYSRLEAAALAARRGRDLSLRDRIRRMVVIAPWLVPLHCLIAKGGLLDGWPGIHYAFQRGVAESLVALRLVEAMVDAVRPESRP